MKNLKNKLVWFVILVFLALFVGPLVAISLAQEAQLNGGLQYDHSPGTGHSDGIGLRGQFVVDLASRFKLNNIGSFSYEPKAYIGDGWSTRGGSDLQFQVLGLQPAARVYVTGGGAFVNNYTSEYSKTAYFLTAGAGIAAANEKYVVNWRHYFRERRTLNKGASDLFEFTSFIPFEQGSRYRVIVGAGYQRSTFTQPNGPAAGEHVANSVRFYFGVGKTLKN